MSVGSRLPDPYSQSQEHIGCASEGTTQLPPLHPSESHKARQPCSDPILKNLQDDFANTQALPEAGTTGLGYQLASSAPLPSVENVAVCERPSKASKSPSIPALLTREQGYEPKRSVSPLILPHLSAAAHDAGLVEIRKELSALSSVVRNLIDQQKFLKGDVASLRDEALTIRDRAGVSKTDIQMIREGIDFLKEAVGKPQEKEHQRAMETRKMMTTLGATLIELGNTLASNSGI